MRLMPPRMTAATSPAESSPVIHVDTPRSLRIWSATVKAWMLLPEPKLEMTAHTAKATARGFQALPRPRSM